MVALNATQRGEIRHDYSEVLSQIFEGLALTKAEVLAAVDATDTWIDDNAGAYNTALPLAARTEMTKSQKARLLTVVAEKRFITDV